MRQPIRNAALASLTALLCSTSITAVASEVTYSLRDATIAQGHAGLIATNVGMQTAEYGTVIGLGITKWQKGIGCESSGCADYAGAAPVATSDGSLFFDLKNTPVGPVKGLVPYSGGRTFEVDRMAFIWGNGSIYTQLVDPAQTAFSFIFSGHSDTAMHGVQLNLELSEFRDDTRNVFFQQTVTTNEAGDWQLLIDTPLGMDLLGKSISFGISATAGANTLTSLVLTPRIQAVPELGTWALMGLGLVGLAWASRNRRPS